MQKPKKSAKSPTPSPRRPCHQCPTKKAMTCEAQCKSRVKEGKPLWIAVYDDCITHCRDLNGVSDLSKKMRELEDRNFRTVWEGEFSNFWACFSMCAEQTPNIVEFRECMGEVRQVCSASRKRCSEVCSASLLQKT